MSSGVTYARGFVAAGVSVGLKPSGAPDLALLVGEATVDVWTGDTQVVHAGVIPPAFFATHDLRSAAATAMAGPEVSLRISVEQGAGTARGLGGDLSDGYVRINGEDTT